MEPILLQIDGISFSVRRFVVQERLNHPFVARVEFVWSGPPLDFERLIGQDALFGIHVVGAPTPGKPGTLTLAPLPRPRRWPGVCRSLRLLRTPRTSLVGALLERAPAADLLGVAPLEGELQRYEVELGPRLSLLSLRENLRVFQHRSEVQIAKGILEGWGITVRDATDEKRTLPREYVVQYRESDLAFVTRILGEAGVSFWSDDEGVVILSDAPGTVGVTPIEASFVEVPTHTLGERWVTDVTLERRAAPGRFTQRDWEFRRPEGFLLEGSVTSSTEREAPLERFAYEDGETLRVVPGAATENELADRRGAARTSTEEATRVAQMRLDAARAAAKRIAYETNAWDVSLGDRLRITDHPSPDLRAVAPLIVAQRLEGSTAERWRKTVEASTTEGTFRPTLDVPRPVAHSVETATVVGPTGEEIWCDELGRVQVQFHWDREGRRDAASSCWLPLSQGWAGEGFGSVLLPRVGQEVLVSFAGGDPDRPIVTGRLFANTHPTPYPLPRDKTRAVVARSRTVAGEGHNELSMEDASGKQQVFLRAERDLSVLVQNDEHRVIGHHKLEEVAELLTFRVGKSMIQLTPDTIRLVAPQIEIYASETTDIKGTRAIFLNCSTKSPTPVESISITPKQTTPTTPTDP